MKPWCSLTDSQKFLVLDAVRRRMSDLMSLPDEEKARWQDWAGHMEAYQQTHEDLTGHRVIFA